MSFYAIAWVYFLGLAFAAGLITLLASSRRARPQTAAPTAPQIKWRCPICAYVFIEFELERYLHCPRCDTLLDAEQDATGGEAAESPPRT